MPDFASVQTNDAQACFLLFHLWRRYIPIAVYAAYAVAQLKGSVSFAGSAAAIRERSFGAARWFLMMIKFECVLHLPMLPIIIMLLTLLLLLLLPLQWGCCCWWLSTFDV